MSFSVFSKILAKNSPSSFFDNFSFQPPISCISFRGVRYTECGKQQGTVAKSFKISIGF